MPTSLIGICRPLVFLNRCVFGFFRGVGVPYICGALLVFFPFYREFLVLLALSRRE